MALASYHTQRSCGCKWEARPDQSCVPAFGLAGGPLRHWSNQHWSDCLHCCCNLIFMMARPHVVLHTTLKLPVYVLRVHLSASAETTYISVIQRPSVTAPCWSHSEAVLVHGDPFCLLQWRFRLSLSLSLDDTLSSCIHEGPQT